MFQVLNQFESALASVFFCILCTMDLQRYSISQYIYILVLDSLIHTYVYTYLYIYMCVCGYSISFSADFIEHQSFVSASHVFHIVALHLLSSQSSTGGRGWFLFGSQFLLWRKDPSNLPDPRSGGTKNFGHDDDSFLAVAFTFGGGCGFHDLGRESWVDTWSSICEAPWLPGRDSPLVKLKPVK